MRKRHIEMIRKIAESSKKERYHTPVPMEARWDFSSYDVLALRRWVQYQHSVFMDLQKEQELLYIEGKSNDDGLSLGYAVSAYCRVEEMLEDIIRWGGDACLIEPILD